VLEALADNYCAPDRGAEYYDDQLTVCVFDCPWAYLHKYMSNLYHFFVHVTEGSGSILLWQHHDTLCSYWVLPVLWMTSYLHARQGSLTWPAQLIEAQLTGQYKKTLID